MYSQVPKWTLNPSPNPIQIPCRARTLQVNPRRIKSLAQDPKTGSLASDEQNELAFSNGPVFPSTHGMVSFNKQQRLKLKGKKKFLTWRDLRKIKSLTWKVPEKIGGGLRAILQGVTGNIEFGEMMTIPGPSSPGKSALLDVLAGTLGLIVKDTGEISINDHQSTTAFGPSNVETGKRVEEIWKGRQQVVERPILKKPRLLCLHGFRTSADILRQQLQRWPQSVLGKLDLVFLDAPYLAKGKSDVEGYFDPPYYEWFQFSEDYQEFNNFEESIAYIEDFMIKHGPFDGLMGFSQGAILSAALPGMQLDGVAFTKVPKIKHVIIMSGGKFGGSRIGVPKLAAKAFASPLKCPSLHIIGESCFLKDQGIELLESFVDPIVIHHPKGHSIARLDEKSQKAMLNFIEKIEKM